MCCRAFAAVQATITLALIISLAPTSRAQPAAAPDFTRIPAIFAQHCYACHGPDAAARKTELRLDDRQDARHVAHSGELLRRLTTTNADERMPPAGEQPLSVDELNALRSWIESGAPWSEHWAFQPIKKLRIPSVNGPSQPQNAIDAFIIQAHRDQGMKDDQIAPEADRITLLRRVSFDLTGLPPTLQEVEAFLADRSPDAYERVVDRLLAAPRYGERMATLWLDATRYADTNGYEQDNGRTMWAWRDWVIAALNRNLPFDQFTIDQLAGDLLPNTTLEQRLATGMHRNHGLNFEGGSISEESRWNYVCDRVNTTASIWLGLTIACARCHDHKYDAISQRDYYALAAFFNNVPEEGYAGEKGNAAPMLKLPDARRDEQLAVLERHLRDVNQQIANLESGHDDGREQWKIALLTGREPLPALPDDLAVYCPLERDSSNLIWDRISESSATAEGEVHWTEGHENDGLLLDGRTRIDLGERASFERDQAFSMGVWVRPTTNAFGPIIAKVFYQGYDLCWFDGRFQVNLVNRWDNNAIFVQTEAQWPADEWHHVLVTYDGSSRASGVAIYVDGQARQLDVSKDTLTDSILTDSPLHIGSRGASTPERFMGTIDEVRVYARELTALEALLLGGREALEASIRSGKLTHNQQHALDQYYLKRVDPSYAELLSARAAAQAEKKQLLDQWPTSMVMDELETPRATHLLQRGLYDHPGEQVAPGTPAVLPPLPSADRQDRLALAHWLVQDEHPLTARVTVNRYWETFFGQGIVSTLDDFGTQGASPTHPELLDWLAHEFVSSGWNVKYIHRLIVTSAAYRRSCVRREGSEVNDENAWVTRQNRLRLPAEVIRDNALAVSGLLTERLGGPGVMPYQPTDLWSELSFRSTYSAQEYQQSTGADLYRRSVYTYWKRTCPPPAMQLFDAGERQECQVRRSRTNTPLQSLVLMNDPTFVEAAKILAHECLQDAGSSPEKFIALGFRRVLSREPTTAELRQLVELWHTARTELQRNPTQAAELLAVGDTFVAALDSIDLAAAQIVMHAILVLDEAITRN